MAAQHVAQEVEHSTMNGWMSGNIIQPFEWPLVRKALYECRPFTIHAFHCLGFFAVNVSNVPPPCSPFSSFVFLLPPIWTSCRLDIWFTNWPQFSLAALPGQHPVGVSSGLVLTQGQLEQGLSSAPLHTGPAWSWPRVSLNGFSLCSVAYGAGRITEQHYLHNSEGEAVLSPCLQIIDAFTSQAILRKRFFCWR